MKIASVEVIQKSGTPRRASRSDGSRAFRLTPTSLAIDDRKFAFERPQKNGENVELISYALASDGDVIWAVMSDTFAVAQGRFVARLTWSGDEAAWGPLKSPYPWSPHSHSGMSLEQIGAATVDSAYLSAFSETSSVLARIGKHPHRGVPIPRGRVAFGTSPPSLLVFANRKFGFYDAAGTELDSFGFSGAVKQALDRTTNIAWMGLVGRELSFSTYSGEAVTLHLDRDPPPLATTRPELPVAKPAKIAEPTGPYGALDPSRSRAPMVLAFERVQAWDLNELPAFGAPARFSALILQPDALSFCREREGRLKKSFDFMARAIAVTISKPPRAAKAPEGVVLASLRTPSGLTQVLCRRDFAKLLAANTKQPKS